MIRELTDHEIYQIQVAKEELEALKNIQVNLYRDENTGEVLYFCQECFQSNPAMADLTYIDRAADWDLCYNCEAQNIPAHYHG